MKRQSHSRIELVPTDKFCFVLWQDLLTSPQLLIVLRGVEGCLPEPLHPWWPRIRLTLRTAPEHLTYSSNNTGKAVGDVYAFRYSKGFSPSVRKSAKEWQAHKRWLKCEEASCINERCIHICFTSCISCPPTPATSTTDAACPRPAKASTAICLLHP